MADRAPKAKKAQKASKSKGSDDGRELIRARMLLDLTRQVAAIETVDEVLATLVDITTKETNSERSSIFLNDGQTGELFSRFAQGEIRREIRVINTSGIAGHVFTTGKGLIVNDAYADERFNHSVDKQTGFDTKSILCAPIRTVKGEVIGVAQALNKKGGVYDDGDLALLEAITTQAAVALQGAQYVERMKQSRKTEREFLNVVSDVTSEINLNTLLQKVMAEATRMLMADRSTLFLNDEKSGELWSTVGDGLDAIQIRLPNTVGIAGAVFTSGQSVNIPYAYADLRFNPAFDKKTGYFTRSILCTPVVNKKGKIIGVTQVLNKRGGPFTEDDEQRLKAFTSQVSIALENAKLFDNMQNMKNYAESMLESMSNGVITMDEDGNVATCNAAGQRILKIDLKRIMGRPAEEVFTGANQWVMEKICHVDETQKSSVCMDAEIEVGKNQEEMETISVNLTVLPLLSAEKKKLGAMLMIEDISAEKRMKSTMSRYMDPALADRLMGAEGGEDLLGGKSAEATVLFSDIRGFTSLTEKLGAQATVLLLNDYFTIMVECLAKEGGMLDKFIGDAIMAAFGLPLPLGDDADRALRAAIAMHTSLEEWNAKRQTRGESPWQMGIGINTDLVVSGNIGSPKRMDYTLIGDGVNLAARLESACTIYSARLLISEFTRKKLKGAYRIRYIDDVVVKGKSEPVAVHEVLDSHSDAAFPNLMDVINNFNEARTRYKSGDFEKSIRSFKECLKAHPGDDLSKTYIERCQCLMAETPKDWDGVWVLTIK